MILIRFLERGFLVTVSTRDKIQIHNLTRKCVRRLKKAGADHKDIAAVLSVTPRTVSNWMSNDGSLQPKNLKIPTKGKFIKLVAAVLTIGDFPADLLRAMSSAGIAGALFHSRIGGLLPLLGPLGLVPAVASSLYVAGKFHDQSRRNKVKEELENLTTAPWPEILEAVKKASEWIDK